MVSTNLRSYQGVPLLGDKPLIHTIDDMRLTDLLAAYVGTRDCGSRYRESLLRTIRKMREAGIESVADLTPANCTRLLAGLSTLSATTRQNIRRELMTLWRYAFEERMTEVPPLRVPKIRASAKPVEAWSHAELQRLLACAEQDVTLIGGQSQMRICDFMPCWICVAYDTGIRFGDMLSLRSAQVRNGHLTAVAHKTGKRLVRPLSPYSLTLIKRLSQQSEDGTLFSWFLTRRRALGKIRKFLDRHEFHGSSKYLRRSCATYIEASRPGEATRYLQHSAATVTSRHYVDESLLAVPCGPPPIR
jgi:integrase